jgi:hypothetical protein
MLMNAGITGKIMEHLQLVLLLSKVAMSEITATIEMDSKFEFFVLTRKKKYFSYMQ